MTAAPHTCGPGPADIGCDSEPHEGVWIGNWVPLEVKVKPRVVDVQVIAEGAEDDPRKDPPCPRCGGTGEIQEIGPDGKLSDPKPCKECRG